MKLPTLNVDLKVNTKSMERDLENAKRKAEKVGKKVLSVSGGTFGTIGSISQLGGEFGRLSLMGGAAALGTAAPIMAANAVIESFSAAVTEGAKTMKDFAEGKDIRAGGVPLAFADLLSMNEERAKLMEGSRKGIGAAFWGGAMDESGQIGGPLGFVLDWAQATGEGFKAAMAGLGAMLGGKGSEEVMAATDIATTRSAGGSQAYMTQDAIDRIGREMEKFRKENRENST